MQYVETRAGLIGLAATAAVHATAYLAAGDITLFTGPMMGAVFMALASATALIVLRKAPRPICTAIMAQREGDGWRVAATTHLVDIPITRTRTHTITSTHEAGTVPLDAAYATAMALRALLREMGTRLVTPAVVVHSQRPLRPEEEMQLRNIAVELGWPLRFQATPGKEAW
ncbi:hypothetical protein ACFFMN_23345 [Planobispora siamensis]|uniref:Uncharacterized protein n=1 Tax=Planobispora siamensis TaxID=936338 RepID=A0A8J3WMT1_9ACTN|nr:hypothetical protein [Planobispora siamensis]GIH95298.1 hypothetical protein Psi01_59280 [Planobispora siamensis]